ncbi:hypothetical protein Tco_1305525, partial [Tanacetum coccineum]
HGLYETIVCYVLLANVIWIVVLERDRLKALRDRLIVVDHGTRSVPLFMSYAFSDSLLLTTLYCDDIHDVTPRVSTLAGCDIIFSLRKSHLEI